MVYQSCLILCDPMDCRSPGSSVHGILQARVLEWVAMSSSRGIFLTQGSNRCLFHLLHWQTDSLPSEPPGKLLSFPGPHFLLSSYRAPSPPGFPMLVGSSEAAEAPPHPTVWPHSAPCSVRSVHPHTSSTHFPLGQASFSTGHSRLQVRAHDPISGPRKILKYICRI